MDAVRYDRTGHGGHIPSPTPTIDKLLNNGLCLTHCFSNGTNTQFALPSLFTSTLPLDKGGYEYGIKDRQKSFVEILKNEGYNTAGFPNGYYGSSFFHYNRGFDDFYTCMAPYLIYNFKKNFLSHIIDDYNKNVKTFDDCYVILQPYMTRFLSWIKLYCKEKEKEINTRLVTLSPILHEWDLSYLEDIVEEDQNKLSKDPNKYINSLMKLDGWSKIVNIDYKKLGRGYKSKNMSSILKFSRANLLTFYYTFLGRAKISDFNLVNEIFFKNNGRSPSGLYMTNNVLEWISRSIKTPSPFFVWLHLMDAHDGNFSSHDVDMKKWSKKIEEKGLFAYYNSILNQEDKFDGDKRLNMALKYTDLQIKYILENLKSINILDDTLLVLTSDHGSRNWGSPYRSSTNIGNFYDEMCNIPMAFIGKDIQSIQVDGLYSSLDIAPTILDLLGFSNHESFLGKSVFNYSNINSGNSYIIAEDMGRGPCDFVSNPISICVRTPENKLVYTVLPEQEPENGMIKQYYNLNNDKDEMKNLASRYDVIGDKSMKRIAVNRVNEIRNQIYQGS